MNNYLSTFLVGLILGGLLVVGVQKTTAKEVEAPKPHIELYSKEEARHLCNNLKRGNFPPMD